jgi:hypothetical protein
MMNNTIYLVAPSVDANDLAKTMRAIKDRMLGYAYDVFEDGVTFFTERQYALVYASGLNKGHADGDVDVLPTYGVFEITLKLESDDDIQRVSEVV